MAKLLLPEKTADLAPLQKGWLQLAQLRMTTFDELQKDELAIQQKLNGIDKKAMIKDNDTKETLEKALSEVQAAIKEAKEIQEKTIGLRKHFTGKIQEVVIDKAMEFEKRSKELIDKAGWKEIEFRRSIVELNESKAKEEKARILFKTHVENEWLRRAADYRLRLSTLVSDSYKAALQQKQPMNQIKAYKEKIKEFLRDVKFDKFNKMENNPLSKEESEKIYNSVSKWDGAGALKAAIDSIDETFQTYEADLKNATKAVKAIEKKQEETKQQIAEEVEIETAQANLIAHSSQTSLSGGPSMKRVMEVVEENTFEWASAVINNFIKNLNECKKHLRVQTYSKLSIGQMASALGKIATADNSATFKGLTLKEIKK